MIEDYNQTTSRRINDLEGDSKQIEKRVEQTARNEGQRALDTSDSIAKGWIASIQADLQLYYQKWKTIFG